MTVMRELDKGEPLSVIESSPACVLARSVSV